LALSRDVSNPPRDARAAVRAQVALRELTALFGGTHEDREASPSDRHRSFGRSSLSKRLLGRSFSVFLDIR
jgi:hypothetical protein